MKRPRHRQLPSSISAKLLAMAEWFATKTEAIADTMGGFQTRTHKDGAGEILVTVDPWKTFIRVRSGMWMKGLGITDATGTPYKLAFTHSKTVKLTPIGSSAAIFIGQHDGAARNIAVIYKQTYGPLSLSQLDLYESSTDGAEIDRSGISVTSSFSITAAEMLRDGRFVIANTNNTGFAYLSGDVLVDLGIARTPSVYEVDKIVRSPDGESAALCHCNDLSALPANFNFIMADGSVISFATALPPTAGFFVKFPMMPLGIMGGVSYVLTHVFSHHLVVSGIGSAAGYVNCIGSDGSNVALFPWVDGDALRHTYQGGFGGVVRFEGADRIRMIFLWRTHDYPTGLDRMDYYSWDGGAPTLIYTDVQYFYQATMLDSYIDRGRSDGMLNLGLRLPDGGFAVGLPYYSDSSFDGGTGGMLIVNNLGARLVPINESTTVAARYPEFIVMACPHAVDPCWIVATRYRNGFSGPTVEWSIRRVRPDGSVETLASGFEVIDPIDIYAAPNVDGAAALHLRFVSLSSWSLWLYPVTGAPVLIFSNADTTTAASSVQHRYQTGGRAYWLVDLMVPAVIDGVSGILRQVWRVSDTGEKTMLYELFDSDPSGVGTFVWSASLTQASWSYAGLEWPEAA